MLKKDSVVKWTKEAMKSFDLVKLPLSSAPILISPNYSQDFILFSFASEHTIATVLMQKRDQLEKPIAFFSRTIRDVALKYNIIEKQALALVKALKYFWDPGGILLNCLTEEEAKQVMSDFHKGYCGGHLFWKTVTNKILRARYNWPTLFADVYKTVTSCHECQIFQGRRKLRPLPPKLVEVSAPFQQWGLDFIGEIHPTSSDQHKCILTATDYFTKWIEAIPTRQATNSVIIQFLENNILSRFGCPNKLITYNAITFKSKKMIDFCSKCKITVGHSTSYYPQGNRLAESSNKSLVNIIKKLLETNKKSWHKKLVNALWADRVSQMKLIGMSSFEIVYGIDMVFPASLTVPVVKLLQEACSEEDHFQRRISQMIHLQ
eukprot:PITA_11732